MSLWVRIPLGDVMRFEPIIVKKKHPTELLRVQLGTTWRKRWDSNPRTSYPVTAFRVRAVMTTSIHFRIFDVDKPLRSGHNRHAVRIAMTTSIHFLIENIYRVSAWFIIVYKIYFCNKFCTTWLLLLTICGFSMPTMLDGRENRRIIIYHIYY